MQNLIILNKEKFKIIKGKQNQSLKKQIKEGEIYG